MENRPLLIQDRFIVIVSLTFDVSLFAFSTADPLPYYPYPTNPELRRQIRSAPPRTREQHPRVRSLRGRRGVYRFRFVLGARRVFGREACGEE